MTLSAKKAAPYIASFAAAVIIALLIAKYEEAFLAVQMDGAVFSSARKLSDGFFVSGALLLSLGGLIAIAEHGGLDALRYALWRLGERIKHPKVEEREEKVTYFDYVKSREEREKAPFAHLLAAGALSVIISLSFALLSQ